MMVQSNGIQIHVEMQGSGDPVLVFLHYWGGSAGTWRHVAAELSATHRTLAVDHRGWGASDAPATGYALADMAGDALGVIDALGIDRYVLVGHSMGGKVAQLIASRRPHGLAGLVLVAPAPPTPMALPQAARERIAAAYESPESVAATIDHVLAAKPLSAADRAQVIADSLRGAPQAKQAWPASTSLEDISGEVGNITVSALVISGESDRVDPPEALRAELMPRLRHAELRVLPETGHLSPLESPDLVAGLIARFVEGLN